MADDNLPEELKVLRERRRNRFPYPPDQSEAQAREDYTWVTEASRDINKQTDRGAAILGGALVEECVRRALLSRLASDFKPNWLPSFAPLIHWAFGLGLVGPKSMVELRLIVAIRNAFAHRLQPLTFDQEPVADLCDKLSLWPAFWISSSVNPTPPRRRQMFLASVTIFFEELAVDAVRTPIRPAGPVLP